MAESRHPVRRAGIAAVVTVAAVTLGIVALVTVSPVPTRAGPANPIPEGSALDMSWIDAQDGWALSSRPCAQGLCAGLEHTSDGGAHWASLPAPPAAVFQNSAARCFTAVGDCVNAVMFATPDIGYLYGPALFVTTDGGRTWLRQTGPSVQTMGVDGDQALRVSYTSGGCPGPCQFTLQAAPVGSSAWHTLVNPTSGRGVSSQIRASGNSIVVAIYGNLAKGAQPAAIYRSLDRGQNWDQLPDPCAAAAHLYVLTRLATTGGGVVDGLCDTPAPKPTLVVTSTDDGSHWDAPQPIPGVEHVGLIAAAGPTTVAVATPGAGGSGPFTAQLLVSTDEGHHWTTAATVTSELLPNTPLPGWLGFQSPQVGRWLSGPDTIWKTSDGGAAWTRSTTSG